MRIKPPPCLLRFVHLALALVATQLALAADTSMAPRGAPAGDTFNVRDYGATGDGATLDTAGLNHAIEACSQAGGGEVLVPAGRYLSGTLHLRSHVTLFLAAGARLIGTTNLSQYEQPSVPSFMPEARWGKWHRALLVAENAEDVTVSGPGIIDGNKVFDPTGEEHMRGPHTLVFVACRNFTIRDISIVDAANYAIFFQASDDVDIRNVKITGGWDGVHFRGAPDRWCHHVSISGCRFFTGDDSIAGRYWDNVVISDCTLNSACNGIRLIGPATHLLVSSCVFYGPGQRVHRTSSRSNMLSGIILQPGAWDKTEGLLDDVFIANNVMRDVASPVTIWTKPGNPVGKITISGLNAAGVYRAALSVESWSDLPITNLVVRNAAVEFSGGGKAEQALQAVKGPGVDARPLPAWGVYARRVESLTLEDVRLSVAQDDLRPVITAEGVQRLTLDSFKFTHVTGVKEPLATTNVGRVNLRETDLPAHP
jgi:hypothetical protein